MSLDRLRFHLIGDGQVTAGLCELLFNDVQQVVFRSPTSRGPAALTSPPVQVLFPVGFERDEGMLPYPNQSFLCYRLVSELFAFPAKFLFLDLGGFKRVAKGGFGTSLEVIFYLRRTQPNLEQGIDGQTFRLGCTPIINLFEQLAEPIRLTQSRYEYRITPDVAHADGFWKIYAVDSVGGVDGDGGLDVDYQPFYSFTHGRGREETQAFWYAMRTPSARPDDRGTDVDPAAWSISVFDPRAAGRDCVDGAHHLHESRAAGVLQQAERPACVAPGRRRSPCPRFAARARRRCRCSRRCGAARHLAAAVAHLNLNHLSLSDAIEGRAAAPRDMPRLYDFSDPQSTPQLASVTRNLIDGILGVSSKRVVDRTAGGAAGGFARGVEVTIEFDDQKYVGAGVYLFASVLERFLAAYVTINSFTRLIARTRPGERVFNQWPPRAGDQLLL